MEPSLYIVIDHQQHGGSPQSARERKLLTRGLVSIGKRAGHLAQGSRLLVKHRGSEGRVIVDPDATLVEDRGAYFIKSALLSQHIDNVGAEPDHRYIALFVEGTQVEARCIAEFWDDAFFADVEAPDPTLRLSSYELPPSSQRPSLIDTHRIVAALYRAASGRDPELYAVHSSRFLGAPHVLRSLLTHIQTLRTSDSINFTIQTKKIADHLRPLLLNVEGPGGIRRLEKSHLQLWASVQGKRFSFLDGGMSAIPGFGAVGPSAFRVGVYTVRPGDTDPSVREHWKLTSHVLADMIQPPLENSEFPDPKRLQEAARYIIEPLVALAHADSHPPIEALFLHGPLINQFLTYDEGDPYYLPPLDSAFLSSYHINREELLRTILDIPKNTSNEPMWNTFMALYGHIASRLYNHQTPMIGVIERAPGRAIIKSLLALLETHRVIDHRFTTAVIGLLDRHDITDNFLFGCILHEGEYLEPLLIDKNPAHRARERWQPVVRQYPHPYATILKSEETNFPFRVELNAAANLKHAFITDVLYHTARLLPNYAFPVGIDIADKYAKIPEWITRGAAAELSASVLRRAFRTGDVRVIAQVRKLLARTGRDFFFRPRP